MIMGHDVVTYWDTGKDKKKTEFIGLSFSGENSS